MHHNKAQIVPGSRQRPVMLPAVLMDTFSGWGGEWSSSQASSQEHPRLLWGSEAWVLLKRSAGQPCGSAPEGPHPAPACLNPDSHRAGLTLGRGSAQGTPLAAAGATQSTGGFAARPHLQGSPGTEPLPGSLTISGFPGAPPLGHSSRDFMINERSALPATDRNFDYAF